MLGQHTEEVLRDWRASIHAGTDLPYLSVRSPPRVLSRACPRRLASFAYSVIVSISKTLVAPETSHRRATRSRLVSGLEGSVRPGEGPEPNVRET